MIAWLLYLAITVPAGLILGGFVLMTRSTKKRGDGNPYPTLITCFALAVGGPFLYSELLTSFAGADMGSAVADAYDQSPIKGPMKYFRLITYTGTRAHLLVVGEEKESWGGTDRPILTMELEKRGAKWLVTDYNVVYSNRLNKDGLVFPPYR